MELATWRFATEPLTIGGQRIAAGEPGPGRTRRRRPRPGTVRPSRTFSTSPGATTSTSGYGHGIHYCLGAPLARLEGQTALATLLHRLPDLRLAAEPADLRWRGGLIMRGLRTLPVEFTPGTRQAPAVSRPPR